MMFEASVHLFGASVVLSWCGHILHRTPNPPKKTVSHGSQWLAWDLLIKNTMCRAKHRQGGFLISLTKTF
jgi:hypothetical protein